jgi:hypothetical protein
MTSRTFAYSRHRRRRIVAPPAPADAGGDAAAGAAGDDGTGRPAQALERVPSGERDAAGKPVDPATHEAGARPPAPRLPHEHDEYADTPSPPRAPIVQAERDLASGRTDTDLRGVTREVFDRALRRERRRWRRDEGS